MATEAPYQKRCTSGGLVPSSGFDLRPTQRVVFPSSRSLPRLGLARSRWPTWGIQTRYEEGQEKTRLQNLPAPTKAAYQDQRDQWEGYPIAYAHPLVENQPLGNQKKAL